VPAKSIFDSWLTQELTGLGLGQGLNGSNNHHRWLPQGCIYPWSRTFKTPTNSCSNSHCPALLQTFPGTSCKPSLLAKIFTVGRVVRVKNLARRTVHHGAIWRNCVVFLLCKFIFLSNLVVCCCIQCHPPPVQRSPFEFTVCIPTRSRSSYLGASTCVS
jgi:hypothetical protein